MLELRPGEDDFVADPVELREAVELLLAARADPGSPHLAPTWPGIRSRLKARAEAGDAAARRALSITGRTSLRKTQALILIEFGAPQANEHRVPPDSM